MLNPYEGGEFRVSQSFKFGTHNGLDIVGGSSKTLLAVCDGTVYQSRIVTDRSNLTWQWGHYVTIKADTGELITYAHLSKRLVSAGERVKKGDKVGIEGNTGYSFGSHCHLEVRSGNNKVTEKINTPAFTGIPNIVGAYTVKEEKQLTKAEVEAMIKASEEKTKKMIDASKEKVYHWWKELPDWAYAPLMALYKAGYFAGEALNDLNITYSCMRTLVVLARALKADGKLEY